MLNAKPQLKLITGSAPYREDPAAVFHQLCGARPATLLLESADIDSKRNLKSLLIVDSALRITAMGNRSPYRRCRRTAPSCCRCLTPRCQQK